MLCDAQMYRFEIHFSAVKQRYDIFVWVCVRINYVRDILKGQYSAIKGTLFC